MKKYFSAILILLPLLFSCDEYELSPDQQRSFVKFYGAGLEDEGVKVLTTNEGFLVMGNIDNMERGKDICLIRTDKYGNSVAPITVLGGQYDDYGYAIEPNTDGYIIAGSSRRTKYGDLDVFLAQVDTAGDTLWTNTYGRSYDDEAYDILIRDDGHIVLTGYSDGGDISKSDFLVIETDANGNQTNFYHSVQSFEEVAYSIIEYGSNYLLAGYTDYYNVATGSFQKTACVLSWNGSNIEKYPPFESLGVSSEALSIKSAGGNEFYIACNVNPSSSVSVTQIYLLKINARADIVWQHNFGERTLNLVNDLEFFNNSLIAVGTATNVASGEDSKDIKGDILILKTNLAGENPEYTYIGDGQLYQGNDIDFTSDGGYIITGTNYISTNSVITLCKPDTDGLFR